MASNVRSGVQQYGDLSSRLASLSSPTKIKKAVRPALRKAGTPMCKQLRATYKRIDRIITPNQKIYMNVDLLSAKTKRHSEGVRIGIRGGAKYAKNTGARGGDTYYWRFLEFGTRRGNRIRARRYARNIFDANYARSTDLFADEFGKQLDKLL